MVLFTFMRMFLLVIRLSLRQLKAEKYFSVAMIINMLLGLIGYLVVDGFNRSFMDEIGSKTRQISGGDLVVSSRMAWSGRQIEIIDDYLREFPRSQEIALVSMVSSNSRARLVDLRFVDDKYPIYPGFRFDGRGPVSPGDAHSLNDQKVWVHKELLPQLGVLPGERIKIGDAEFLVDQIITDDSTSSAGSFAFAPRVYAPLAFVDKTKLLATGSRVLFTIRFEVPPSIDLKPIVAKLKEKFTQEFPSQDIRVQTHYETSLETSRLYAYLNDYLSLIALVSLFLAGIGFSYLIRSHLDASIFEVAVMSALGAARSVGLSVYMIQCILLGLIATFLSIVVASVLMPLLAHVMEPLTGAVLNLKVPVYSGIRGGFLSILAGTLFSVPQLLRLWSLKPSSLLMGADNFYASEDKKITWSGALPALSFLWLVAVFESRSITNGSIFAITIAISTVSLALIAIPLSEFGLIVAKSRASGWRVVLALRFLGRNRAATSSTFVALALGTTLLNVIPQLRVVISREIMHPDSHLPQLFMFDVQDEQVSDVKAYFGNRNAVINSFQPMVRARLESINGQPMSARKMNLEGEREEQQRQALQSRTQNLSYRQKLSGSEQILSGKFISEEFRGEGVPALSVEEGFAKRVGLKLGDRMVFDVMGVQIEGEISSLRRVRWTSFEPNFMILVQPGVLNDAPKTWVGSASRLDSQTIDQVISDIVSLHSNITIVDIKSAVVRLLTLVDKIGDAVGVVSWLALMGGCGVLFAIAYARSNAREYDIGLLQALGATPRDTIFTILVEYAILAFCAVLVGVFLSFCLSWAIARFIFNSSVGLGDLLSVINGIVILPLSIFLAWLAIRRAVRVKIISLLN